MIKLLERTGIQGTFLNKIKAIYSKFIAKINPNREKLKATELKKSSQITQPAQGNTNQNYLKISSCTSQNGQEQ